VLQAAPLLLLIALASACGAETDGRRTANVRQLQSASRANAGIPAPLPRLSGRVVDGANILSSGAEAALAARLARLEAATSDQLVVVTTNSLAGETIEAYGLRLGNGWGIGRRDLDNGVLLIVAPNERKSRIEVGRGLEGLLTDARAAAVIDDRMIPAFRHSEFERGIAAGVEEIVRILEGDTRRPQRIGKAA
jgi:uncharacterized protein